MPIIDASHGTDSNMRFKACGLCFQKILAYGFPRRGKGFEKRAEERTFENIDIVQYVPLILTPFPTAMVLFNKEISLKTESTCHGNDGIKYIVD